MSDRSSEITLGEVYRVCQRIEAQVMLQNGRVRKLEDDAIKLRTIWAGGAIVAFALWEWLKHKLGW